MTNCKFCRCKIDSHSRACNRHKHLLRYEKKLQPRNYQRVLSWFRNRVLHVKQRNSEVT